MAEKVSVPFFSRCSAAPLLFTEVDLYKAGSHGYETFRIPALVVTSKGTLLAFGFR